MERHDDARRIQCHSVPQAFLCMAQPDLAAAVCIPRIYSTLTRAPLGGGGYFEPPLVFLRYLPNQCRYYHQTFSTLSPNNFTHCVKILKSRVL